MDAFHTEKVFSAIDRHGRYAWGNQPAAGHWNLTRLAEALLPILSDKADEARSMAEEALADFSVLFDGHYTRVMGAKLGLCPDDADHCGFPTRTVQMLADEEVDFSLFFRHLTRVAAGADDEGLAGLFGRPEALRIWLGDWRERTRPDEHASRVEGMARSNPFQISRNHRVEECIQAAQQGNFTVFHRLVEALNEPFVEMIEFSEFEKAPTPGEVVCRTYCGT